MERANPHDLHGLDDPSTATDSGVATEPAATTDPSTAMDPASGEGGAPIRNPYDPATALVVVDVQNDFADPAGSLAVRGGDAIVEPLNAEITRARDAGATVVYTQDWHPESTPHFEKDGGIWPVHCVADTWGAALHQQLEVHGPIVRKGSNGEDGYSGFTMRDPDTGESIPTELEAMLRARSIERVRVAGLATDYCVKATALDAARLGFGTTFLEDLAAAVDLQPGDGARAIDEMRQAGVRIERSGAPVP